MIVTTGVMTTGIYRINARVAAKYPIIHRSAPTTKNDLAQNVNNAEVRNPHLGSGSSKYKRPDVECSRDRRKCG